MIVVAAAIVAAAGASVASVQQPNGRIVFFADQSGAGGTELFVADLGSGKVRRLTYGGGYAPSWSPDGSEIAFERTSTGPCGSPACSRIWIIGADGLGQRPFTPPNLRCEEPAWSPSGDRIAYVQWTREGVGSAIIRASIYIRTITGTVRRLTHETNAFDAGPVWSPDGSRIVFSRGLHGRYVNYVVNADGSDLHRLRGNPDTSIEAWSPDGNRLTGSRVWGAYNNRNLLVVLNADGTGERRLLSDGGDGEWSPDGEFIAFIPDNQDIYRGTVGVIQADGTGRHLLISGRFTQLGGLDWTPSP